jgi:glycosyltransferase involved in cell wall biosynthesis
MQIHATNINGTGAVQVVKSFLQAFVILKGDIGYTVFLPESGHLKDLNLNYAKVHYYRRYVPQGLSRFIECTFSPLFFRNIPTLVLGDIPLRGIHDQVVFVHQSNLVYPKINSNASRLVKFRISRLLFRLNVKYTKSIIVQTGSMANDLILSYPSLASKVVVITQPPPNWLKQNFDIQYIGGNYKFFYPSAFYIHKRHEFLKTVNDYCLLKGVCLGNIEVWLTLSEEHFRPFENIKWIRNLGPLNSDEMNFYYSQCDSLLFLSSLESYGLPLIEAMTLGIPIVVVDFQYSKWLCAELVEYFEPYDVVSFLSAIDRQIFKLSIGNKPNYSSVLKKFTKDWMEVVRLYLKELSA